MPPPTGCALLPSLHRQQGAYPQQRPIPEGHRPYFYRVTEHRTPELIHTLIAAFKAQHDALFQRALADEGEGLVSVFFEWEAFIVEAKFQKDAAYFVQLIASPLFDPEPGEPAVVYHITPPEGAYWR